MATNHTNLLKFAQHMTTHICEQCDLYQIEFRPVDAPFVQFGEIQCSGYFDDKTCVLAFAVGKSVEAWVTTMIHEYCHMMQFKAGLSVWTEVDKINASVVVDKWLEGVDYSDEILDRAVQGLIDLERDCEQKTSQMLRSHNAPIDVSVYNQKANAYIIFYKEMRQTRKWYDPMNPPYANEAIYSLMPTDYDTLDYKITR